MVFSSDLERLLADVKGYMQNVGSDVGQSTCTSFLWTLIYDYEKVFVSD
jgi:hypothetical protein